MKHIQSPFAFKANIPIGVPLCSCRKFKNEEVVFVSINKLSAKEIPHEIDCPACREKVEQNWGGNTMRKRINDLRNMEGFEILNAVTLGRGMSSPNDPRPAQFPSIEIIKEVRAGGYIWKYDIDHNDIFTRDEKTENP